VSLASVASIDVLKIHTAAGVALSNDQLDVELEELVKVLKSSGDGRW
jgi:hypothetical protein